MIKHGVNNYYVEVLEKVSCCKNKFDVMAEESKYIKVLKPNLNMGHITDEKATNDTQQTS